MLPVFALAVGKKPKNRLKLLHNCGILQDCGAGFPANFQKQGSNYNMEQTNYNQAEEIRIGASADLSAQWLPRLAAEFRKKYPTARFSVSHGSDAQIAAELRTGEIALGILDPESSDLPQTALFSQQMTAVLPQEHLLVMRAAVPLERMAQEKLILQTEHAAAPLHAFAQQGCAPQITDTADDDDTVLAMVEAGLGTAILPAGAAKRGHWAVAERPLTPPVVRQVAVCCAEETALSPLCREFLSLVRTRMAS